MSFKLYDYDLRPPGKVASRFGCGVGDQLRCDIVVGLSTPYVKEDLSARCFRQNFASLTRHTPYVFHFQYISASSTVRSRIHNVVLQYSETGAAE